MHINIPSLPVLAVNIDASAEIGPLELWRHALGQGGINSHPLPQRVIDAARALRPRLVRIFIQEFFDVFPEGRFDWARLDAYIDSISATGAKIVAAICIKPRAIFPQIDQRIWQPADWAQWQRLIGAMAQRYSVQREAVSHWEVGNEVDIGETGGCPYLIPEAEDYAQYYQTTIEPILQVAPHVKVGGPGNAGAATPPMPGFIRIAIERKLRVDFISWHRYGDGPSDLAADTRRVREWAAGMNPPPELMITEFAPGFHATFVADQADDPRRVAIVAATIFDMLSVQTDWSFYYHLWDQVCFAAEFEGWFSSVRYMLEHWNDHPHRFGMFGVEGEVRPVYFLYQLLARMGHRRLAAKSDSWGVHGLRVLASRGVNGSIGVLLINQGGEPADRVIDVRFTGLERGMKRLTTYRIDGRQRFDEGTLELQPLERRPVDTLEDHHHKIRVPADAVAAVFLDPCGA